MPKAEIYEIAGKALPPSYKQAIEWGPDYFEKKSIENYIDDMVSKYIFDSALASVLKRYLYIDAMLMGMAHFEELTKTSGMDRYISLSQIKGASIDEKNIITPIPDKDGEKYNSIYQTLYSDPQFKELQFDLEQHVKSLRAVTPLIKVRPPRFLNKDPSLKFIEVPEWLFTLYNEINHVAEVRATMNTEMWRWETRKNMMRKAIDQPVKKTIEYHRALLQRSQMELLQAYRNRMAMDDEDSTYGARKYVVDKVRAAEKQTMIKRKKVLKNASAEKASTQTQVEARNEPVTGRPEHGKR